MKKTGRFVSLALVAVIAALFWASFAQAEITICTPINQSNIPYTITTSGVYCLTSNLIASSSFTSGNMITINAGAVVLDLNDHTIGGAPAGSATQAIGIYANSRKSLLIRNGLIRGFAYGVKLEDSAAPGSSYDNIIEGINADANTEYGIYVVGRGTRIHNSTVINTGGSTIPGAINATGVYVKGAGATVRDNAVTGTMEQTAAGTSYAVYVDISSPYSTIDNNRLTNPTRGPGTSYGVYANSPDVVALHDIVFNMTDGFFFVDGTGLYKNCTAIKTTTPFTGSLDGGLNNSNN